MLALSISGLFLLARRAGGWRFFFKPMRVTGKGQLHAVVWWLALPGLFLSSLTALWKTTTTFGLLPEGASAPVFPAQVSGQTGVVLSAVPTLEAIPMDEIRSLSFPAAGDVTDVFTLKTASGEGNLDQGTGALLGWTDAGRINSVSDLVTMLHTGQGIAWLGLLLGLAALGAPLLGWSGLSVWLAGRHSGMATSVPAGEYAPSVHRPTPRQPTLLVNAENLKPCRKLSWKN